MRKQLCCYFSLLCLVVLLAACVPYSFSPPTEVHITTDDHIEQAVISMDDAGRSHIAGVVNDRIVYFRTNFGSQTTTLTMTMTSFGTNWKQYDPDIAATDSGIAWLVWVEQRGGLEKFACYREITLIPPIGGYETHCNRLSSGSLTTGNVMVIASGNIAYALYDHIDTSGRVGAISYIELTNPSNVGIVYGYTAYEESGYLYSWDAGIDQGGYLHVAFHDNDGIGSLPYQERLIYRSNRSTQADGTMTQSWYIFTSSNSTDEEVPVSIAFYMQTGVEMVIVGSGFEPGGLDEIWIDRCTADGCGSHYSHHVVLPPAWLTNSTITDVELLGVDGMLHLGFIGDNGTDGKQVYYQDNAFASDALLIVSGNRPTWKFDLEAVVVETRPEAPFTFNLPVFSWGETNLLTVQYYSYDGITTDMKVYDTNCVTSLVQGEAASNGIYYAGVWEACLDTWFSTQAHLTQLPLVVK